MPPGGSGARRGLVLFHPRVRLRLIGWCTASLTRRWSRRLQGEALAQLPQCHAVPAADGAAQGAFVGEAGLAGHRAGAVRRAHAVRPRRSPRNRSTGAERDTAERPADSEHIATASARQPLPAENLGRRTSCNNGTASAAVRTAHGWRSRRRRRSMLVGVRTAGRGWDAVVGRRQHDRRGDGPGRMRHVGRGRSDGERTVVEPVHDTLGRHAISLGHGLCRGPDGGHGRAG